MNIRGAQVSKEKEFSQISLNEAISKLQEEKHKILEEFAKAYLAETELLPSQIEMCHQQLPIKDGIIENIIFFRKKA